MAPYRIGKHRNPQNRAKIHQKTTILGIFGVFLAYFCPLLLVGALSFFVGGQVVRNACAEPLLIERSLPSSQQSIAFAGPDGHVEGRSLRAVQISKYLTVSEHGFVYGSKR